MRLSKNHTDVRSLPRIHTHTHIWMLIGGTIYAKDFFVCLCHVCVCVCCGWMRQNLCKCLALFLRSIYEFHFHTYYFISVMTEYRKHDINPISILFIAYKFNMYERARVWYGGDAGDGVCIISYLYATMKNDILNINVFPNTQTNTYIFCNDKKTARNTNYQCNSNYIHTYSQP